MEHTLFLYNPHSGRQRSQMVVDTVVECFEEAGKHITARPLDFAQDPFDGSEGFDSVVVAGGDGTVGYVVDAMIQRGLDLPLGIIPAGTANDFATMLGLPHSVRRAAQRIIAGKSRRIDCGRVNGRHFVNIFSFGLFTTTSQHTPDEKKRQFGRLAYLFEGIHDLQTMRSLPLTIKSDDEEFSAEVVIALIFNGNTAGRIPLARMAKPDDELLDGVFLLKRNLPQLVFDAMSYLCGGNPASVKHLRSRRFQITSPLSDIDTDTDGQQGPSLPLDIECLAGRINILS